jgi:MerR family transcriptional regulator, copper efflux regulator
MRCRAVRVMTRRRGRVGLMRLARRGTLVEDDGQAGERCHQRRRRRDPDRRTNHAIDSNPGRTGPASLDSVPVCRVHTDRMWISEAAEQAGVNVQTVRYYERRGLLPKAPRRASGYREFPAEAVRTVRFIKRAQELGFSLDEVEELLRLQRRSSRDRPRIRKIAERRIAQIDQKIAELDRMRTALRALVYACHEGTTLECPIIDALDTESGS